MQLKYADPAGSRFAVLMGSDEQARGAVTVKDLQQNKQHEVPRNELVAKLQELLMEGGGPRRKSTTTRSERTRGAATRTQSKEVVVNLDMAE